MAPPLFFLLLVILILAVLLIGGLVAIRTGLWVRETSPKAEVEAHHPPVDDDERHERRPEHVKVEDPARQRYIGT